MRKTHAEPLRCLNGSPVSVKKELIFGIVSDKKQTPAKCEL